MVENQKLFRVSRLQEHSLSAEVEVQIIQCIRELPVGRILMILSRSHHREYPHVLQELKREYDLKLYETYNVVAKLVTSANLKFRPVDTY